jgi:hypothetical protein
MAVILSFSYYEYYKSEIECFRCTAVLFSWLFFQSDNFQLNCKLREIYVEKGGSHSNTLLHQKCTILSLALQINKISFAVQFCL